MRSFFIRDKGLGVLRTGISAAKPQYCTKGAPVTQSVTPTKSLQTQFAPILMNIFLSVPP